MMKATHKMEEPFLGPNSFAGDVLRAVRLVIKVRGKGGMVSKTPPFCYNRFFRGCYDYVEIIIKPSVGISIVGVSFEGRIEKNFNR